MQKHTIYEVTGVLFAIKFVKNVFYNLIFKALHVGISERKSFQIKDNGLNLEKCKEKI